MTTTDEGCRCAECAEAHSDFLAHFGRWPTMSHDDAAALVASRARSEARWARALR